ncbi:MAG TPA: NnrS family protein [Pseudolabrys sp.]
MPKTDALQRRREYAGPALFAYGFRPFFLAAGLWGAFGILLWLPLYSGDLSLPAHFGALDWHIHEMLYGYVAATVAGFLLTAIPNWTGRLPVSGWPLAGLALLWLAGRAAILLSGTIGGIAAAVVDVSFLVTLAAVAGREIVAGKNWRNLRVLVVLGVLIAGNVVYHAEVLRNGAADYGIRIAIAAVIALIMLIGGRIVPSFTNNWLTRNNPGRLPVPFARFDMGTIAASAVALLAWIAAPAHTVSGALLLIAGVLQAVRLARWAGERTLADRLVLVLHIGYAFVPLGFLLIGASIWSDAVPASAGMHAWSAGAFGLMTLAVMTRATLGHTGQPLAAGPVTQAIYGFVLLAAVLRIVAAFAGSMLMLEIAGVAWIAGFTCFVLVYGPLLAMRKPAWKDAIK